MLEILIIANLYHSSDISELLKRYKDQYLKMLYEDTTGFVRRVGDEGGGAFEVQYWTTYLHSQHELPIRQY